MITLNYTYLYFFIQSLRYIFVIKLYLPKKIFMVLLLYEVMILQHKICLNFKLATENYNNPLLKI